MEEVVTFEAGASEPAAAGSEEAGREPVLRERLTMSSLMTTKRGRSLPNNLGLTSLRIFSCSDELKFEGRDRTA